jgi:ankyrin repeat protein
MKNDIDSIDKLIASGANLNEANNDGWTALHHATRYNQPEVAKLLIEKEADIHLKTPSQTQSHAVAQAQVNFLARCVF